ncbi:hypothetical protein ABZ468_17405 [Streptomyces sp. NPDC005708]|uniref:hypothetical protein n=1 Tax=unclassified Streptomyces TaxID=2593676 RepID=UPI0033E022E6
MSPSIPHTAAFDAAILLDLSVELILPSVMLLEVVAFVSERVRERLATRAGPVAATFLALGPAAAYVAYRLIALTG